MITKTRGYVFVTAGRWQVPAIMRAKEMGFHCIAIDSNPNSPGLNISDTSIVAALDDLKTITSVIDRLNLDVCAVLSYCSEIGTLSAAYLREYYHLGFPGRKDVYPFLDKSAQRRILDERGFANPKWCTFEQSREQSIDSRSMRFPLVVKPVDSSGSRGVLIANTNHDLSKAAKLAFRSSKTKRIIVEEFIEGTEYTVDVAAQKGNIQVLLITKKTQISTEIKTVSSELCSVDPNEKMFQLLSDLASRVFHAFGLVKGVGHLEAIRGKDDNFYVVEAAIRGGGFNLANGMVIATTGFDYCQWCIDTEANIECDEKILFYKPTVLLFQPSDAGVLQGVSGIEEANLVPEVHVEQLIQNGREITKAASDSDRVYSALISAASLMELQEKKEFVQSVVKVHYEEPRAQ